MAVTTQERKPATTAEESKVRRDVLDLEAKVKRADEDAAWWREKLGDRRFQRITKALEGDIEKFHAEMEKADGGKELMKLQADIKATRRMLTLLTVDAVDAEGKELRDELAALKADHPIFFQQRDEAAERREGDGKSKAAPAKKTRRRRKAVKDQAPTAAEAVTPPVGVTDGDEVDVDASGITVHEGKTGTED